jgi:CyaY protein
MTDLEYLNQAEQTLSKIEHVCDQLNDAFDLDVDNQRNGGMLTLTFGNRSQIIINLQKPLHEIWVAAQTGGYHFKWSGTQWLDTKVQTELFTLLGQCMRVHAGDALFDWQQALAQT